MASMRVQGVETAKEKVKVRSPRRPNGGGNQFAAQTATPGSGFGDGDGNGGGTNLNGGLGGWGEDAAGGEAEESLPAAEKLSKLLARGESLTPAESLLVKGLMMEVQAEEEVEALVAKGSAMTSADKARVQELTQREADATEAKQQGKHRDEGEDVEQPKTGQDYSKAAGIVGDLYADSKAKHAAEKAAEQIAHAAEEDARKLQAGPQEGQPPEHDDDEDDDGDEPPPDELARALALAEDARAVRAAETASDREAAAAFARHADADGCLHGQRVLVQCLGQCGVDPAADLR
jgi:hypothetical protein